MDYGHGCSFDFKLGFWPWPNLFVLTVVFVYFPLVGEYSCQYQCGGLPGRLMCGMSAVCRLSSTLRNSLCI